MANNKSKKTNKKSSTKPKNNTAKTEKTVTETVEVEAPKVEKVEKTEETTVKETVVIASSPEKPFKGFFARKFDAHENILTIFKTPRIYGAICGELIGTMLIAMLMLTLGVYQPLYVMFGMLAITIAVYGFSGANINPLVTVGMMASRRMSAIRGVLYIVAQVVGAWLGLLVVNAFRLAGDGTAELPAMSEVASEVFWVTTLIEFMGGTVIGFFFARALQYKRSVFTFAAIVAGGVTLAILFAVVISSNFLSLQNNFILNPAVAIMYQIFPTAGEIGEIMGGIMLALVTYVIFPMLGGVLGFYMSDFAGRLSGEEAK